MEVTKAHKKLLDSLYYNENKKYGLRGIRPLHRAAKAKNKSITLKIVKNWLRSQPTYTLWRPARTKYPRNKFKIRDCTELMQFDLMVQTQAPEKDPETDSIMTYALIAQDSYSRFTFVVPLPANKSKNIQNAMDVIFATGYVPSKILADKAGEHISASTHSYFKRKGIHFYTTSSKTKAPQAERFIRTARTYIRRYQNAQNTDKWLEPLRLCVYHYNRTVSRVTGQKPIDILKKAEADVAAYAKMYDSLEEEIKEKPKKDDPKVGDTVRLSRIKGQFDKESGPAGNYTREYFTVKDISRTQKIPMFGLMDHKGKDLEGRAYATELQKIHVEKEKDYFEVSKVHRKKKVRGKQMALVSWVGYTRRHDSWIPVSDLKTLKQGSRNVGLQ